MLSPLSCHATCVTKEREGSELDKRELELVLLVTAHSIETGVIVYSLGVVKQSAVPESMKSTSTTMEITTLRSIKLI